jgi:hypothetical protein
MDIGNARVAGLEKDLHMTDHQYQICVTILYVYVGKFLSLLGCAELPSFRTSSKSASPQNWP